MSFRIEGAGGASYSPLIKGVQLAGEELPIGSTSATPFTFNTPTGGSGSYSYSAVISHIEGSGASLSGSGLGPYSVTNLEDNDVVIVILTITDTVTGQTLDTFHGIEVIDSRVTNLVSGGDPSGQTLSAGTTTSDPFTFNAPTGDTYTATYTLYQVQGSGASLSGSGLGPYTINNLSDGDVCLVSAQFTGDTDGDVVRSLFICTVSTASASTEVVAEYDFTSCTDVDISSSGSWTIYESDGTTVKCTGNTWVSSGALTENYDCLNGTGLQLLARKSGTGSVNVGGVSVALPTSGIDWDEDNIVVEFQGTITLDSGASNANDSFGLHLSTGSNGINLNDTVGWSASYDLTDINMNSRRYDTSASNVSIGTITSTSTTDIRFQTELLNGRVLGYWDYGTGDTDFKDLANSFDGGTDSAANATTIATSPYGSTPHAVIHLGSKNTGSDVDWLITKIRVLRRLPSA